MKRASARDDRVTSKCLTHDTSATTEAAGAFKTRRHTKLKVASRKAQGEATWARVDSQPGAWNRKGRGAEGDQGDQVNSSAAGHGSWGSLGCLATGEA